jgi:predicted AAA+ superfamily ATPase
MTTLKAWREIAVPHQDVLKGTFQQAEFAADLSRVHDGTATEEYQNPALFFQRTFITEGMRLLLDSVIKRLAGRGGDPVIQLQTAFGGGKTHTMLAVYHLAKGETVASELLGIPPILDAAGITELPKARLAVLDGIKLSPNQPQKRGDVLVHTLWGELAWQLGKESAYEQIKDADLSGTSPGKQVLANILRDHAPCVLLMDELVAYIRQFEEGKTYTGGSYDSNLSFIQALTEGLKAVPNAVLLASLPESDKEAGSQRGIAALASLSHYFARVHALWKPVGTEEAFEIVRRRLFNPIADKQAAENVCRGFADFYVAQRAEFPNETHESPYYQRLLNAYPIHPEVFDRLYEDWSTLDNFQRTRGVLKLMAKVIHRLWKDGNNDLMILPSSLPLYDADTRNEAIYYLPQGWDPVLERDIDGERAETTEIESKDTRVGSLQGCRRAARTIFLGSAPSTPNQMVRGIEAERVILGCAQPGQQVGIYKDALTRLTTKLHYLNHANNRYWFDTRPNLRREMEERKRRFKDKDEVYPEIRDRLQKSIAAAGVFAGVHVFTSGADIPDDWSLRLVVLPPDASFAKSDNRLAVDAASTILKKRGDQPRQKQNRLLFLVADYDTVARLTDQVRSTLAWQSIVGDYKENRIVLDNLMAKNAAQSLESAKEALQRTIRETYKWLLAPMQEARPGKGISDIQWEHFALNTSAQYFAPEIERVLKENELLITEWSPIHLLKLLKDWFWKDGAKDASAVDVWQKTCCYLYMPRLKNDHVLRNAVAAGAASRDFFGFAYGKEEGKYLGFMFGQTTIPMLESVLLIEPTVAAEYELSIQPPPITPKPDPDPNPNPGPGPGPGPTPPPPDPTPNKSQHFYGTINLDPVKAKMDFAKIVDEVLLQFTSKSNTKVSISIEIQADTTDSFDEGLQRVVRENCNVLGFGNAEFE